jgi:hypothetical protein
MYCAARQTGRAPTVRNLAGLRRGLARRKLRFVSRLPSSALFRRGVVKDREE